MEGGVRDKGMEMRGAQSMPERSEGRCAFRTVVADADADAPEDRRSFGGVDGLGFDRMYGGRGRKKIKPSI